MRARRGARWPAVLLGGACVFLLAVRLVAVRSFVITSDSMESTLMSGDVVLARHAHLGGRVTRTDVKPLGYVTPRRGEVWVFRSQNARGGRKVKRLIGLPGDTLAMQNGVVWVNGEELDEPYTDNASDQDRSHAGSAWQLAQLAVGTNPTLSTPVREDWGPQVIPEDSYFALGDNRDQSWDSRHTGLVTHDRLEGRVAFVLFSYGMLPADTVLPRPRAVRWSRIGRRVQ